MGLFGGVVAEVVHSAPLSWGSLVASLIGLAGIALNRYWATRDQRSELASLRSRNAVLEAELEIRRERDRG